MFGSPSWVARWMLSHTRPGGQAPAESDSMHEVYIDKIRPTEGLEPGTANIVSRASATPRLPERLRRGALGRRRYC